MKRLGFYVAMILLTFSLQMQVYAAYRCTRPEDQGNERESGVWTQDDKGWRFVGSDGQTYANHWLLNDRGFWNYFDENGYAVTGMQTIEGKRRYFTDRGDMRTSYFVYDGHLYCAFKDGEIRTSLNGGNKVKTSREGVPYKFDAEGHAYNEEGKWDPVTAKELGQSTQSSDGVKEGWAQEGKIWCYYSEGQKLVNSWHQDSGFWYYFDESGSMLKSCVREIDGQMYKFTVTGAMATSGSATDENGVRYLVQKDGTLNPVDVEAEKRKEQLAKDPGINSRQQLLNEKTNPYNNNDTVQWFNATYAILTKSNTGNIRAVGGATKVTGFYDDGAQTDQWYSDKIREGLARSWNVTDKASADQVLEGLVASGNATGSAWDYSRAMSNLGNYYIAGYYTIEETLDKSLEIAKIIQTKFNSWDAFVESYLAGYASWAGENAENRRWIYEQLKQSAFNPYNLDWNLPLEKSW